MNQIEPTDTTTAISLTRSCFNWINYLINLKDLKFEVIIYFDMFLDNCQKLFPTVIYTNRLQ